MNTSSSTIIGIPDFQTGVSVIARAPLANPPEAIRDFDRILDSLLAAPPDHETFFRLLEHLRPPAVSAAEELSKRFVDKPVPLGDIEAGFFKLVARFWLKIAKAYKHCAEMDASAADTRPERLAALLHRCIHFTGLAIREHHRARQEVPWGLWLDLHGYYGTAEDLRLAFLPIP
ncbi:MAG: hypothetical protein LBS70_06265, partial [Candidatus Accumulibacter sp.]|nr:hypothetical protein [Accumulibacter sp.]